MTAKSRSRLASSRAERARDHRDRRAALPDQDELPLPNAQARPHIIRGPPLGSVRLLSRAEVVARIGVSFPTIWTWMRAGKFPRSRDINGTPRWLSNEIDAYLLSLPLRRLKGDDVEPQR
jgi:predicted DNA-binding transcriptional regulator AlpA